MSAYDRTVHPTLGETPQLHQAAAATVMPKAAKVFVSIQDGTLLNGVFLEPDAAVDFANSIIEAAAVARRNRAAWDEVQSPAEPLRVAETGWAPHSAQEG